MKAILRILFLLVIAVLFPATLFAGSWAKTFGGSSDEVAYVIQETSDNGFIVAGYTLSFGAGEADYWIIKLDKDGNVDWEKTYGGASWDEAVDIHELSGGGYIVAGTTTSFGAGDGDYWVIKLDEDGNIVWQKTYGGASWDEAAAIDEITGGGFIIAGSTTSYGSGDEDYWIVKLDAYGNTVWQKTYDNNGTIYDKATDIHETSDGGFIVAGDTYYSNMDQDQWILKLDPAGVIIWEKTYGGIGSGASNEYAKSIHETFDGGYIVSGSTETFGSGYLNYWVIKLDPQGNVDWQKAFSNGDNSEAFSVSETADHEFIAAGYSFSSSGYDYWVLKLDLSGNILAQKQIGGGSDEMAYSAVGIANKGFVVAGYSASFGAGGSDYWILKLDSNVEIPECDLVSDTSIIPEDTAITPNNTDATVQYSDIITGDYEIDPIATHADVETQCFYESAQAVPSVSIAGMLVCCIILLYAGVLKNRNKRECRNK